MLFPIGGIMIVVLTVSVVVIGSKVRANSRRIAEISEALEKQ